MAAQTKAIPVLMPVTVDNFIRIEADI